MRNNLFARILSIFLALILWLFVAGDNITRTTPVQKIIQGVPLQVENLSDGLVVQEIPATVNVTLEGLTGVFEGLTAHELEAYIDLTDRTAGRQRVKVRGKPPRGLTLIAYSPEQVEVVLEAQITISLPVEIDLEGVPATDWEIGHYWCNPARVMVQAPRSVLETVKRAVVSVNISGARNIFYQEMEPLFLDEKGQEVTGLELKPEIVAVTVNLVQKEVEENAGENDPHQENDTVD